MHTTMRYLGGIVMAAALLAPAVASAQSPPQIVHDAEYYILEAQNRQVWAAEDAALDARLAELRAEHGTPPNIIHVMWDDTSFGDVGIPAISQQGQSFVRQCLRHQIRALRSTTRFCASDSKRWASSRALTSSLVISRTVTSLRSSRPGIPFPHLDSQSRTTLSGPW